MRRLLEPAYQRVIKIIELLLEKEDWTTFAGLSALIDVSERTIASDVLLIKDSWGHLLDLEVSKKHGVRLLSKNNASLDMVFIDIYNNSVVLRLIKEVFYFPNKTIEYYEKKLFVSRSTLLRIFPKINEHFSRWKMMIRCTDGGYEFFGEDEQQLRDSIASFLHKLYGLNLGRFDPADAYGVDPAVIRRSLLSFLKTKISLPQYEWTSKDQYVLNYLTLFFIVSLTREQQGKHASSSYHPEGALPSEDIGLLQQNFPLVSLDRFNPIYEYMLKNYNYWTSPAEEKLVTKEIELYFDRFFSELSIRPNENSRATLVQVMTTGYFMAKIRPFKSVELFTRAFYFSVSVKNSNPFIYQVMKKNLKILSERIGADMSVWISMLLYWTCLVCPEVTQLTKPMTILLIDGSGELHTEFLVKVLLDFMTGKIPNLTIDTIGYPATITDTVLKKYDILLTTIPHLMISDHKMILMNDFPRTNDWIRIYEAIRSKSSY